MIHGYAGTGGKSKTRGIHRNGRNGRKGKRAEPTAGGGRPPQQTKSGLSVARDIADIGENDYRADELFNASLYQLSRIFFISLRA